MATKEKEKEGGEMKDTRPIPVAVRNVVSGVCVLLLVLFPGGAVMFAQEPQYPGADPQYQAPPPQQGVPSAQGQIFTPDQISNLVAPIALYPDNLLSQVLAASTYPLEVVEAAQWLQQNRNLTGQQLIDAARQQNWDPSIQAMVVFPDVLNRLASDVQWTTALGNAYLGQQADVMAAVQRLRAEAQASGKLQSNAQQQVTTQQQNGQSAIEIVPANPEVVYVPVYNPEYVWGPPVWGFYPPLYYPAFGFGFGFGPGIFLGGFFPGFAFGFGGWGWGCNWWGGGIFARPFFFSHYGFHPGWGGWHGGAWGHVADHRLGVPYSNRAVASRFGGNFSPHGGLGQAGAARGFANGARGNGFGGNGFNGSRGNGFAGPRGNGFNGGNNFNGSRGNGFAGPRGNGFNGGNNFNGSRGNNFNGGPRSFAPGNPGGAGNWQHFGQPGAGPRGVQPGVPSNPSFGGNNGFRNGGANTFRAPSAPSAPSFHSAPPAGGNFNRGFSAPGGFGGGSPAPHNFSPAPRSFGGGSPAPRSFGGGGAAPRSFGGGGGFNGGGGGGFHGGGGGGGFHGGGGGGHGGRR
jgi:hypothetical protein